MYGQIKESKADRVKVAQQTVRIGIVGSLFLAIIKGLTGYYGHTYVLIADAIESVADTLSSIVSLIGIKIASAPPSEQYPYGKGRAETLAAVFVSLFLFASAAFIVIQSVHEIRTPHMAPAPFTLIVLLVVLIIKELLFRFIFSRGSSVGSMVLKIEAWHQRSDALTSLAAFIGISIALLAGPGYESADDWAALFAAMVMSLNAYSLLRPALGEILEQAPDQGINTEIRAIAAAVPGVMGTHKCHVRKLGLDFYVDLDVIVSGDMSVTEGHQLAHMVQDKIREELPVITKVLVHVEPFKAG